VASVPPERRAGISDPLREFPAATPDPESSPRDESVSEPVVEGSLEDSRHKRSLIECVRWWCGSWWITVVEVLSSVNHDDTHKYTEKRRWWRVVVVFVDEVNKEIY